MPYFSWILQRQCVDSFFLAGPLHADKRKQLDSQRKHEGEMELEV